MDELHVELENMICECCEKTCSDFKIFIIEMEKNGRMLNTQIYIDQTLIIQFLHWLSSGNIIKFVNSEHNMDHLEKLISNIKKTSKEITNMRRSLIIKR